MNASEMNLEQIEARLAEIGSEVEQRSGEELNALKAEVIELQTRKAELKDIEERANQAALLQNKVVEPENTVEIREENKTMEQNVITIESKEYRDAFYAMIGGTATEEQRAVLATPISVDGNATADGAAIAIPKALDEKIWDNIHTSHPILADVNAINSGVVMEVTRHTANTSASAKKDATDSTSASNDTFVKVTLAGKDYEHYVELTYAEAKMSQGALEDYLATEIAAELGEALAKDVFAKILSDAGTTQKVTPDSTSPDLFGDLKKALGLAKMGGRKVVYAPSEKYYEIVGAIKSGSPFNMGATLGVEVKLDDAATKVTVVDPKAFVLNEVQGVMIESDKNISKHRVIVSGYLRAEGCLRITKAAAYIN